MKAIKATLYALRIPFVEGFAHSESERAASDSVVVKVEDAAGNVGFGEGVARPYVTGETPGTVVEHLAAELWPLIARRALPSIFTGGIGAIDRFIPERRIPGVLAPNASRCALELALLDLELRARGARMACVLAPRRNRIVYSGIITAGSAARAAQHARQMKLVGITQLKVKVGAGDDVARVAAVRETMGPQASIRIDANGAWTIEQAIENLRALEPFGIAACEQPLSRCAASDLWNLRTQTCVPIMADESLVTFADADALIAARAVDYFNIRVSKCGGLARSLVLARRARDAGIKVQVGCQVGETAILSAAGRHLAAALPEVDFVEGSYGSLLLTEDVSADGVRFGHRGEAPLLTGPGLGVRVIEERLSTYAAAVMQLS